MARACSTGGVIVWRARASWTPRGGTCWAGLFEGRTVVMATHDARDGPGRVRQGDAAEGRREDGNPWTDSTSGAWIMKCGRGRALAVASKDCQGRAKGSRAAAAGFQFVSSALVSRT